jgi:hypothetical protein
MPNSPPSACTTWSHHWLQLPHSSSISPNFLFSFPTAHSEWCLTIFHAVNITKSTKSPAQSSPHQSSLWREYTRVMGLRDGDHIWKHLLNPNTYHKKRVGWGVPHTVDAALDQIHPYAHHLLLHLQCGTMDVATSNLKSVQHNIQQMNQNKLLYMSQIPLTSSVALLVTDPCRFLRARISLTLFFPQCCSLRVPCLRPKGQYVQHNVHAFP